jgi:hypothetical protein
MPAGPTDDYWTDEETGIDMPEAGAEFLESLPATVEPTGYTYPYPFAQFQVLPLLYRAKQLYPYITVG